MPIDKSKRFQSQTDRDLGGAAARAERAELDAAVAAKAHAEWEQCSEQVTPLEVPAPLAVEDITGQHMAMPEEERDPEKLREDREKKRSPGQRLGHLEDRVDGLHERVDDIHEVLTQSRVDFTNELADVKTAVGNIDGKLSVLPDLMKLVGGVVDKAQAREHVTFTAQVDVDTAKQTAEIETETARKNAEIQKAAAFAIAEKKAELAIVVDKKKNRRKLWTKIATTAIGGMAVAHELIHWLTGWL